MQLNHSLKAKTWPFLFLVMGQKPAVEDPTENSKIAFGLEKTKHESPFPFMLSGEMQRSHLTTLGALLYLCEQTPRSFMRIITLAAGQPFFSLAPLLACYLLSHETKSSSIIFT